MPDLEDHERKVYGPELEIPELGREPSYLPYFRQFNQIITALAHLVAKYGNKSVLLRADADGKLLVNTGAAAGATEVIPFWAAAPADHIFTIADAGGPTSHDYGAAANHRIIYKVHTDSAAGNIEVWDADSDTGKDRELLSLEGYFYWHAAYTIGRYLTVEDIGATNNILAVRAWDV